MKDIYVGNIVKVFVSTDSTGELDFYSNKFTRIPDIAAFPSIETKKETRNIEDYRQDFTTKLSGDISVSDVNLSVLSTNHPTTKLLEDALMNKQKLRFKITYEEDYLDENTLDGQIGTGLYHVFDAYVVKKNTTGANNAVVVENFSLAVDGPVKRGYAEAGKILVIGDFGVGAGTTEVEGPKDLRDLSGNRWITVDADNTDNVYAAGTSLMSIQHPDKQGWQLIGSPVGTPSIRIRNIQKTDSGTQVSKWTKVYTEHERPTAQETGALPINGGTLTGDLIAQNITAKTVTQDVALVSKPQDTRVNALTRKDYVDSEINKVKQSVTDLDNKKANKTDVDSKVDNLQEQINKKAEITYVDQKEKELSDRIDTKLDKTDFEKFKTENTAEINKKSDKTYVDSELAKKTDKTYTDSELSKKADTTYVDSELANKSDITYVDREIEKVKSEIIGSDEFDKKLDKVVFEEYTEQNDILVQQLFVNKANRDEVDLKLYKSDFEDFKTENTAEIDKKADKTYTDDELAKKSDITYVDSELSKKSDITYVDSNVDNLQEQIDNITIGNMDHKLDVTVFEDFKTENTSELNKIRTEFMPLNDAVIDFGEI
ncbi:TPA: hypothetical protein MM329_000679 [Escherichia coli]|nr:hypothetical protein [Escherichia coli]HBZ8229045.1 hypothetical protein [Escherichia coli]HBZ8345773.1 hypothetical protein [Escherichia coli]HBZ8350842.1 hypothetical protein [Escherichia coli]HBZ8356174.1 hypothetical protein [Escherichia coli]